MNILAFLLALAVFVVAIVYYLVLKQDFIAGGVDLALSIAMIVLTYPSVLNRSS
jgi:hypothetical protein